MKATRNMSASDAVKIRTPYLPIEIYSILGMSCIRNLKKNDTRWQPSGCGSIPDRCKKLLSSPVSSPARGPTQPPIQWETGKLSRW